jgi:hypothetical protein
MAIEKRTVSDEKGNTFSSPGGTQDITGTIQAKGNNPYIFYVQHAQTVNGVTVLSADTVNIVLPVGGSVSGFYRFPRVGENVLVENVEGVGYCLLGYLPNELDTANSILPYTKTDIPVPDGYNAAIAKAENARSQEDKDIIAKYEKDKKVHVTDEIDKLLKDKKGMVLRYQQTGKAIAPAGEEYSEIGFYHNRTEWKTPTPENYKDDMDDNGNYNGVYNKVDKVISQGHQENYDAALKKYGAAVMKDNELDEIKAVTEGVKNNTKFFPYIDCINIKSTGDIKSKAANYHLIKGNRLEILAGSLEIDHTDVEKRPLGDVKGDDSGLHRGDIHLRAEGRVVIKANKEIRLQVGRTILTINDEGMNMTTKKINSNWPNSFDTNLSLNPRSGISMFGQSVNISSAYSSKIGDSYGGGLSFSSGTASLSGREVSLGTQGLFEYGWLLGFAALEQLFNIGMVGAARDDRDPNTNQAKEIIQLVRQNLKEIPELVRDFVEQFKKYTELSNKIALEEMKKTIDGDADLKKIQELEDEKLKLQKKQEELEVEQKKLQQEGKTLDDEQQRLESEKDGLKKMLADNENMLKNPNLDPAQKAALEKSWKEYREKLDGIHTSQHENESARQINQTAVTTNQTAVATNQNNIITNNDQLKDQDPTKIGTLHDLQNSNQSAINWKGEQDDKELSERLKNEPNRDYTLTGGSQQAYNDEKQEQTDDQALRGYKKNNPGQKGQP